MHLLQHDHHLARLRVALLLIATSALAVPAYILAWPTGIILHGGGAVAGLIVGLTLGHRRHATYERSVSDSWDRWMQNSRYACNTPDIHRRVTKSGTRIPMAIAILLLTLAWTGELGLLLLAFLENDMAQWAAWSTIGLNGLLVGAMLGYFIQAARWYRTFRTSLDELIQDGELPVWGVR